MTKELLKQALEALEIEQAIYRGDREDGTPEHILEAITAIKEYMAQPEPIETYIHQFTKLPHPGDFGIPKGHWWQAKQYADQLRASTLHPEHDTVQRLSALVRAQQITIDKLEAQQEQEPVAEYIGENWDGSIVQLYEDLQKGTKLYTSPPQRKPLTDEQWQVIADTLDCFITRSQKDIIEAKLKENT